MKPDDHVRLKHIADALNAAIRFIHGRRREELDSDEMLTFALVHALRIVGEAACGICKMHLFSNFSKFGEVVTGE